MLDDLILWVFACVVVAILGAVGWAACADYRSPKIELRKDEWTCTRQRAVNYLLPVGNVLVPSVMFECAEYVRHEA